MEQLGMHLYSPTHEGQAQLTYSREYIDTFGLNADNQPPGDYTFTTATSIGGPAPQFIVDAGVGGGAYIGWIARPEPYNLFATSPWVVVNGGALGAVDFSPNNADPSNITFPFTMSIFPPVLDCTDHKIAKFRMFGEDNTDTLIDSGIVLCDLTVWVSVPGTLPPDAPAWAVHESFSNVTANQVYDIAVPDNARLYFQFKNLAGGIDLETLTLTAWVERGGAVSVVG